jgi:hypothetical protein
MIKLIVHLTIRGLHGFSTKPIIGYFNFCTIVFLLIHFKRYLTFFWVVFLSGFVGSLPLHLLVTYKFVLLFFLPSWAGSEPVTIYWFLVGSVFYIFNYFPAFNFDYTGFSFVIFRNKIWLYLLSVLRSAGCKYLVVYTYVMVDWIFVATGFGVKL